MTATLRALRSYGVLSALDVQLARALGRLGKEQDERVLVAAALASRQAQQGHICLDVQAWLQAPVSTAADSNEDAPESALQWPSLADWLSALRASRLVGDEAGDESTPLYLDAAGRLYLRRLYQEERTVAEVVGALAQSTTALEIDEGTLQLGLARLFPSAVGDGASKPAGRSRSKKSDGQMALLLDVDDAPAPPAQPAGPNLQRVAAERAVRSRLTVITGGPGTGKTHTVVNMLALLVEQRHALRGPPLRVLLLAPTGKAARRLSESVSKAKSSLACESRVRDDIPTEAITLHRALGIRRDTDPRGQSAEPEPLTADVVIVDEASMVDLALMARLLRAVPRKARLVLLGDKDQLASVEAGAVLGDVCGAGTALSASSLDRPLARCIVELKQAYRFTQDSGIRKLAEAIRNGDVAATLQVLRDPGVPDVTLREHAEARAHAFAIDPELWSSCARTFGALLRERDVEARLKKLEGFRVLCAHRQGPFGVVEVNRRVEHALREAGVLRSLSSANYAGRPILITENDRDSKLFNGDVGVLHEGEEGLRAYFPTLADAGKPHRNVSLARLPAHESVYAMSVHKSQGSEATDVAVVLPDAASPLLSRELLYTAVTRARESVVLYASVAAIEACVQRPIRRVSGLRDALWGSV